MQVRENVLRFIHNRRALLGAVNENIYPIMHVGVQKWLNQLICIYYTGIKMSGQNEW